MVIDADQFLDSLCKWLANGTSLQYAGTPRALWRHSAVEEQAPPDSPDAPAPYSVLKIYGGGLEWVGVGMADIQCLTRSSDAAAATSQASDIFDQFTDGQGRPLRMTQIAASGSNSLGIRINSADLKQLPSFMGKDDRGVASIIFNIGLRFVTYSQ